MADATATATATAPAPAPAPADTNYKFAIKMSCGGCSGAIERTLKKMEGTANPPPPPARRTAPYQPNRLTRPPPPARTGVKSYDVSLETQSATVVADPSLGYEDLLGRLKKTGKTVEGAERDGVVMAV
jgi:copper chaperone